MNVSPPPYKSDFTQDEYTWQQWFLALYNQVKGVSTIVRQASDPTVAQIDKNEWLVVKNTTSGALKLWANDNGTLKSVTLT